VAAKGAEVRFVRGRGIEDVDDEVGEEDEE